jgi:hypothetical protein
MSSNFPFQDAIAHPEFYPFLKPPYFKGIRSSVDRFAAKVGLISRDSRLFRRIVNVTVGSGIQIGTAHKEIRGISRSKSTGI